MSYVDTILLDANRRQSEEFKSGNNSSNNSDFTNKMGVGVKLNPGDKVSVSAGYLSRRGAGGDTIELTGEETGKKISLNTVTKGNHQKMINPQGYFGLNIPAENYSQIAEVYGVQVYDEKITDYPIKDNEAHFNISYYKNTNGEGYFHLPRRYDAQKKQFLKTDSEIGPVYQQEWVGLWHPSYNDENECYYAKDWTGSSGAVRPPMDCFRMGMSYGGYYPTAWDVLNPQAGSGLFLAYNHSLRRCSADMYFYQEGQTEGIHGTNAGGGTGAGGQGSSASGGRSDLLSFVWKKKNDNSRYTLFQKDVSYFAAREPRQWFVPDTRFIQHEDNGATTATTKPNNSPSRHDYQSVDDDFLFLEPRDPAQTEYILYQETKKVSVDPGNYSPNDLASLLTDQLTKTEEPKYVVGAVATRGYPIDTDPVSTQPPSANSDKPNKISNFIAKQVIVSTTTESTTHKTFHAATSVSVEEKAYIDFQKGNSLISTDPNYSRGDEIQSINYLSSYQSVGFKRPELYLAGKKIMKELGYRYIGHNDSYIDPNTGVQNLGNFSKIGPNAVFDWETQRPAITDTDTAPDLHGGYIFDASVNPVYELGGVDGKYAGWSWKQIHNPFIVKEITFGSVADDANEVVLSYHWNQKNLDGLKEFFDVQGKYPELFEGVTLEEEPTSTESTYLKGINSDNARFFHINHRDSFKSGNQVYKNSLGTDFYYAKDTNPSGSTPEGMTGFEGGEGGAWGTDVFFFDFDKSRKDVASGGDDVGNKYYGLFIKRSAINPYTSTSEEFIAIDTTELGGIMDHYFDTNIGTGALSHISAGGARTIGFDLHFSAYGNSAIALYAGYLSAQIKDLDGLAGTVTSPFVPLSQSTTPAQKIACLGYPLTAPAQEVTGQYFTAQKTTDPPDRDYTTANVGYGQKPIHQYLKFRYVGAENPAIIFDPGESKFSFAQLHTPERVGNINNAGETVDNPIAQDTNQAVYFVNKRLLLREFCPDMYPYSRLTKSVLPTQQAQLTTYSSHFNSNITPFSIMDADSGIFIEDFGYENLTDEDWNLSLWAMMGFQRSQFHSSQENLSRQTRINNTTTTDNIGKPTTNANVEPADLSQLITNIFGAELRTSQIPAIMGSFTLDPTTYLADFRFQLPLQFLPGATVSQKSAQINAQELPIKTKSPYLLIKSDIISDTKFIGSNDSGISLPIISVVNKDGASTDFFFGSNNEEFTITNPKTITSIRTQILNPNGSLAELDGDTSVIYKVMKQNNASLNVAQEMMEAAQKNQKKKK
jgi:hypothetical protein